MTVHCCTPVSDIPSRRHLRSATRHHVTVPPRYRLSTFGRRAFSAAGLTVWNSLPALSSNSFRELSKMNLFQRYHSAHTHTAQMLGLHDWTLYKFMINIDIVSKSAVTAMGFIVEDKRFSISVSLSCTVYQIFNVEYNGLHLKSGLGLIQGHWKWHHLVDLIRLLIGLPLEV